MHTKIIFKNFKISKEGEILKTAGKKYIYIYTQCV